MTAPTVLDALRDALGDAVSTTDAVLADARSDKSGHVSDAPPLAVVSARSIADVQTVMRIASATGTPVVTRGAGTGLAGGALGGDGEIDQRVPPGFVRRVNKRPAILTHRPPPLPALSTGRCALGVPLLCC